ncbi:methylaspartate mutase [Streptomyces sp. SID5770]|uniref:methylaspartate mutase n=1 Tax=Streptomyces sp. SID5770 TaxID=2690308 RepID=UPI0013703010|nr:methylaspartate mutase [Streptomyces sp. SID5770]MZE54272.1 methylaspartate mutase [Streptomyces sp. SID5770]
MKRKPRTVPTSAFSRAIRSRAEEGLLTVQPRMGFAKPKNMRAGLLKVKALGIPVAGTITLDSYTRVGDHEGALNALRQGHDLNGYPLVSYGPDVTSQMLSGVEDATFPIQLRHGSAFPLQIVSAAINSGLTSTEGGPISYCLPYSRRPLKQSATDWAKACEILSTNSRAGVHVESFGGCLMGQLCPPSLLVAISVLEGIFFKEWGLKSVSLSYAQQTNILQDIEAVKALQALAYEFLVDIDWHIVIYAYMGVFPETAIGIQALMYDAVKIAVEAGAERLIVKTAAEAYGIPTVEDNLASLIFSKKCAERIAKSESRKFTDGTDSAVYKESRALVEAALNSAEDITTALVCSVESGRLDVPYCLHPDNLNRTRTEINSQGRLKWASVGNMPLPRARKDRIRSTSSREFLMTLNYMRNRYDNLSREQLEEDYGVLSEITLKT